MSKTEWSKTQYHNTTVSIWSSQGSIMALLKEHLGVAAVGFQDYQGGGGGVIFQWENRGYRFDAIPIEIEGASDKQKEAAERQVWRWLYFHVKDLIGSRLFIPVGDTLLPYMLMPGIAKGEQAMTLAEAIREGKAQFQLPPAK